MDRFAEFIDIVHHSRKVNVEIDHTNVIDRTQLRWTDGWMTHARN